MTDCLLAATGTSAAGYIIIAAIAIIAGVSLLTWYFLIKRKYHPASYRTLASIALALVLTAGVALIISPSSARAGGSSANCPSQDQTTKPASQNNNQGGGNQATLSCQTGWVVVPGNSTYNTTDFCLMKYNAKNVGGTVTGSSDINGDGSFMSETYLGGVATSQAAGQPWANISQTDAITAAQTAGAGAHLLTENEWMTIAHNILTQPANWCDADGSNCGAAPGTAGKVLASGHNDNSPSMPLEASTDDAQACYGTVTPGVNTVCGSASGTQKRTLTLSNGEVIWDLVGNVLHWTSGTETRGNLPSNSGSGGAFEYNIDTGFGFPVPDNWGTLAYTNPAVANPLAASWGMSQGVGFLGSYFSSGSPAVMAFVRGGYWVVGPVAGVFTLDLELEPDVSFPFVGFRAAR